MAYIPMVVDSIRISPLNQQRVLILKEAGGERYLPIWVGPAEADAIAIKMQGVSVPRPLTHDFLCIIIDTLGATVSHAICSELKNDTHYAKLVLNVKDGQIEIDCRPSDALAVAVRVGAPIYAEEVVLDKAGIFLDGETGKPVSEQKETGGVPKDETSLLPPKLTKDRSRQILWTQRLQIQEYIDMAAEEAKRLKSGYLTTGHFLLSLEKLWKNRGPTAALSEFLNLDMRKLKRRIEDSIRQGEELESVLRPGFSTALDLAINRASHESLLCPLGSEVSVRPEHILLGLLSEETGIAAHLLNELGIDVEKVLRLVITMYRLGFYR